MRPGVVLLMAIVCAAPCGAAGAKGVKKPAAASASAAPKAKAKAKKARLNMPKGWQWPASKAMVADGEQCKKDLDRLGVKWKPGKAQKKIVTPIVVEDMTFGALRLVPRGGGAYVMDCHLALALVRYAAPALGSMHVTELHVGQIYKYREVAGKPGVLSRHALGLAMDVISFVTDDGVEHVVEGDYVDGDDVLREIEARINESGGFRILLTPGNDPKRHHDHFHFEARVAGDKPITKTVEYRPEVDEGELVDDGEGLIPPGNREVETNLNAGEETGN